MLFFPTCFNQYFTPLTNEELPQLNPLDCPTELLCSEDEVLEMLSNLDTSRASWPDSISGMMLKHTASSIGPILMKLFNMSIRAGKVPTAWKTSTVVPIPKSKDGADPSNYLPISSTVSVPRCLSDILPKVYYLVSITYVQYLAINEALLQRSLPKLSCSQSYMTGI